MFDDKNDYSFNENSDYTWKPSDPDLFTDNSDKKKKKKKDRHVNKFVVLIVSALIFGIIAGGTTYAVNLGLSTVFSKKSNVQIDSTSVVDGSGTSTSYDGDTTVSDVTAVVNEVMPSIVAITTTAVVENYGDYFSFFNQGSSSGEEVESGSGSGIIIGKNDSELLIVTSNHVVEDSTSVYIQFVNDTQVQATVKSSSSAEDLAIVSVPLSSIDEDTLNSIKIATMATDDVQVGEPAIAIGNALGYGQSVTTGVISAVDREVTVDSLTLTLIQTDAAINPGNSGGALLNTKGEVIGINEAKYSETGVEGMGFAIPISAKSDIINQLINTEAKQKVDSSKKGYLGIYGRDVSEESSQMYNIPEGIYVTQVIKGGAAEAAGINEKDVITEFDGQTVTTMEELQDLLQYYESGTKVKVKVQALKDNQYTEKEVELTLTGEIK
jgi:serine protease Do